MFSSVAVKAGLTNVRDPKVSRAIARRLNRQAKRRFDHARPDPERRAHIDPTLMADRSMYRRLQDMYEKGE